ncbi:MAG: 3-oxoacid CoA-transferase subunit B [Dehalococcoidia bacterium]
MTVRERIARRVALECKNGYLINLGAGLPALVASFLPHGIEVMFQSENGIVGTTGEIPYEQRDPMLLNASSQYVGLVPGASIFGSDVSFGIMRGGHLDLAVLGAMQVDQEGNLANWWTKDGPIVGMGGAMDLVVGAKRVIVATEHCDKNGNSKIRKLCDYPLTAQKCVSAIVTELAVMEVTARGLVLREISSDTTIQEIISKTDADLIIPETVCEIHYS